MKYFLTMKSSIDGTNLERLMIERAIKSHSGEAELLDITSHLKYDDDNTLHDYLRNLTKNGKVYLMPEVATERMADKDYFHKMDPLSPSFIPGGMSILAQVYAILGHQPTRYDNLIAAFAEGHIKALRATGATGQEVKEIALRNRLAEGGSFSDERHAAFTLGLFKPLKETDTELIYEFGFPNQIFARHTRTSIMDYLLMTAEKKTITVAFTARDDSGANGVFNDIVRDASIYSTDEVVINRIRDELASRGYDCKAVQYDHQRSLYSFFALATKDAKYVAALGIFLTNEA